MKNKYCYFGLILTVLSFESFAEDNYELVQDISSVSFATIKNQYVIEPVTINTLSGTVKDNGQFDITVDLKGINTGIPIRDTRLNEIFFKSDKYSNVKVTGEVDKKMLDSNSSHKTIISTNVSFLGKTSNIEFPVVILKSNNIITVSSSEPIIISAAELGIPSENLTALAATVGGIKISDSVPLTLNITFNKNR